MISIDELLMGRAKARELPDDLQRNLSELWTKINVVRLAYGKPMRVTSGYRRPSDNDKTAGGAKASLHLRCWAVDIADADGKLWTWCLEHLQLLKDAGLWLEDKRWTPTWVHFGCRPPQSGHRIFVPSLKPALAPEAWSGKYDTKFD